MKGSFESKGMFWANLTYFILLILFTTFRLLNALGVFSFVSSHSDYIFTLITQVGILFLVTFLMYRIIFKQKPKEIFKNFMVKKVSGKTIFYALLLGITVYFIIIFVSTFFSVWLQIIGYEPITKYGTGEKTYSTFWEFLLGVFFVAVLPGLFEEFTNRGMLMSGFKKGSPVRAVLLSGLLFGLMHLNINQFFYATVSGMIMATVVVITKSIWPSVIIHFTNNALNTYVTYATENDLFGANLPNFLDSTTITIFGKFLLYLIFISFVVFICILLISKIFIEKKKQQYKKFKYEVENLKEGNNQIDLDNYDELSRFYIALKKEGIDCRDFQLSPLNNSSEQTSNSIKKEIGLVQKFKIIFRQIFASQNNYKPTFKENFFLYCSLFLGAVVTIFTFIFGLL